MGLETFTYITSLNENNPLSSDQKSEGDDHLRGTKKTLLASFGAISGAVTATHTELNLLDGVTATTAELNLLDGVTATTAELNYVDGVTSNVQTQVDAKLPLAGGAMTGSTTHADNIKSKWGSSDDLEIFHDASNSYVSDTGTGNMHLRGSNYVMLDSAAGEVYIQCEADGPVLLHHNNVSKLATSASGVTVTGTCTATSFSGSGTGLTGIADLDSAQTFTAGQRGEVTALTDTATIATDLAASNNFSVTLAGNRTLANPTNCTAGQSGSYFISQDGTGSRTLAFGTYFKFVGGTAPTLSTTASAVDRIDYVVQSATAIHAVASLDVK